MRHPVAKLLDSWSETCPHPLCGIVVDLRQENFQSTPLPTRKNRHGDLEDLIQALCQARRRRAIVFLGENHDNPTHHQLQAQLFNVLATETQYTKITAVLEQVRMDQNAALGDFLLNDDSCQDLSVRTKNFFNAVQWIQSGWPDPAIYQPLIRAILSAGAAILPGNPERDRLKKVSKYGLEILSEKECNRLKLNVDLSEEELKELINELDRSHFNMIPREALSNIASAQRYRDAHIADVAIQAVKKDSVVSVVVAGNGHTRIDRGSPNYVRQRCKELPLAAQKKPTLSIMPVEIPLDEKKKQQICVDFLPADFVVYTPYQPRENPRKLMEQIVNRLKDKKKQNRQNN